MKEFIASISILLFLLINQISPEKVKKEENKILLSIKKNGVILTVYIIIFTFFKPFFNNRSNKIIDTLRSLPNHQKLNNYIKNNSDNN